MTREKTIRKILDTVLWTQIASNDNKNILTNALVKALEQESNCLENPTSSTTENDLGVDCVSRKAVDRLAQEYLRKPTDDNVAFYEHFLELPSVIPIRPKGYWRKIDVNMYVCSKCSHVLTIDPLDNSILEMNTCPFCGVKMKGVEE